MNDDRLAFILRSPALVERIVRGALREALRSRRYRTGELEVRTFANAALSELERVARESGIDFDAIGRLELQNATVTAAGCFASSIVARRLFSMPAERFRAVRPEIDVAVLDPRKNVHLVRLELVANGSARAELARGIARALPPTAEPSKSPQLHLLSLRDGRLRPFGDVFSLSSETRRGAPLAVEAQRSA